MNNEIFTDNLVKLSKYRVNRPGELEVLSDCLYDWITPVDQFDKLQFFSQPMGGFEKTYFDTNMVLAGQLPPNVQFLIQGLQLGVFSTKKFGTTKGEQNFKNGELCLTIGNRTYVQYAPIGFFPPLWFDLSAKEYLKRYSGFQPVSVFPLKIDPYLLLESNQFFSVQLCWKNFIKIPRVEKIGVMLFGLKIRNTD